MVRHGLELLRSSLSLSVLILRSLLWLGGVAVLSIPSYATTFYVATTGNDANAGTATAPFATIQRGVNLAKPGDTISVADGTYGPNGNYTCGTVCSQNGYAAPVQLAVSGTASAPITISAQNKWGAILNCQLPYGYSGDGTDGVQACDTYFNFQNNVSYIVIRDFDITADYWNGAMINGTNDHDIKFIGNHFHNIGNRHYVIPTGADSWGIEGVYAGTGTSNITFDGNIFNNIGRLPTSGQSATDYNHDHGLYLYNGPYTITNNIFYAQTAGWDIQISPGTHDTNIINNTFQGPNPQRDGLIELWADTSLPNTNITIQNNIFYDGRNYAIDSWQAYEVATLIDHNIVYGSPSGVIDTSVISGTITVTNNRINTDPMFQNVSSNDYHLQGSSPAIDTGASVNVTADFDGNPRPLGAAFDLGAYEYTGTVTISQPLSFSVSLSNNSVVLTKNSAVSITVNASLTTGTATTAAFTLSGLPSGLRTSWSTAGCTLSCSSTLRISTGRNPPIGTWPAVLTVTAGGIVNTADLTVTVTR